MSETSLPTSMKVAMLHEAGDLRLEELPLPTYGDDDVLIDVKYNGLCGTDATEFTKGPMMTPLKTRHPNSGHLGPVVLGHEFIGTVVAAGKNATAMIGKRIACGAGISCGTCLRCSEGRTNLCTKYYTLGTSTHGGLAEYVAAPANICVPIPDSLSDEDAALAQPLAVGIHGVTRSGVKAGDTAFVLGVGAIGSFVVVGLKKIGVKIIAADVDQGRLDVATKLGAEKTLLMAKDATPEDVKALFGESADVVFETSGAPGAVPRAIALTKNGGVCTLMGLNKVPEPVIFSDPVLREVVLQTTVAHVCRTDIPAALEILATTNVADLLRGPVVELSNVAHAFELLTGGTATGKILVKP
jgi:2-desacetyl-2-hydroxyethyl bacteriochlorophyllide A dehydrogenase